VQTIITGAAGYTAGTVPTQRLWYLGGAQTVHGHAAGAASGDAFWMARGELSKGSPLLRPAVFADVGWAGSRTDWARSPQRISGAGVGFSAVDGLVRFDVSRGIEGARKWRVDLYIDAR
jgi:hemolysin activation/secretion protein